MAKLYRTVPSGRRGRFERREITVSEQPGRITAMRLKRARSNRLEYAR
jgi:hypothetical protein